LEDNLEKLSDKCRNAIGLYTEEVDEDPEISEIFVKACKPFWSQHCQVGVIHYFSFCCDNYVEFYQISELKTKLSEIKMEDKTIVFYYIDVFAMFNTFYFIL
jgi:hypothetical protein